MSLHHNSGFCEHCQLIFNRYSDFNASLMGWFFKLQKEHPEAHVSCAGRGRQDQEALFLKGATKAHYGHSAHNYNAAIDLFEMSGDKSNIYERKWFRDVIAPRLPEYFLWYGTPLAEFYELPHVELRGFKGMVARGELKLVEE